VIASVVAGLTLLAWAGVGSTFGAFSATTADGGNSFSAAADFVACTSSTTVVAKTSGYVPGFIKQGGTYYVYANVSDTGNPASGISSVTANVSTFDSAGAAAVALASGSFSVGGVTYNYKSASRTVKNPLAASGYTYSLRCTDNASNAGTQNGFLMTVDNTPPAGSDVQTANGGRIPGRPEQGDTVTFTYTEQIDPDSILSGWTGASTNVVVRINDGSGPANDSLQVWNASNGSQLPLGQVDLGRKDYVGSNRTFGASGTASAMVQTGATITITLGTASGAGTTGASGTMSWTPSNSAYDRARNACSTAVVTESGGADLEF